MGFQVDKFFRARVAPNSSFVPARGGDPKPSNQPVSPTQVGLELPKLSVSSESSSPFGSQIPDCLIVSTGVSGC